MRTLVAGLVLAASFTSLAACSSPSGSGFVPPSRASQSQRATQDNLHPIIG
jgi:uncharacterized lipoprotein YajG